MAVTLLAALDLLGGALSLLVGAFVAFAFLAGRSRSREDSAVSVAMVAACALLGVLQVATGIGLLRLRSWGRTLQIVGACLGLVGIPCGTIISILILFYMLKPEVRTLFSGVSPRRLPPDEVARVQALAGGSMAMVVIAVVVLAAVAVPITGIVAAIAIPSLLRARVAANEAAAIGDLRTMVSAQTAYGSVNGGLPDRLECLATPDRCLPQHQAGSPAFLDASMLTPTRRGYRFEFVPGAPARAAATGTAVSASSIESWAYLAVPVQPGQTGVRAFCADMSGVVCTSPAGQLGAAEGGACPQDCTPLARP